MPPCSLVGTAAAQTANSPLREVEQEVGLGAMLGEHLGSRESIMWSRVWLEFTLCSHATCHGLAPRSESLHSTICPAWMHHRGVFLASLWVPNS